MEIRLWEMDIPYELVTDSNDDGVGFVRIKPLPDDRERDDNYDICLESNQCLELARVLTFIAKEIKHEESKS